MRPIKVQRGWNQGCKKHGCWSTDYKITAGSHDQGAMMHQTKTNEFIVAFLNMSSTNEGDAIIISDSDEEPEATDFAAKWNTR